MAGPGSRYLATIRPGADQVSVKTNRLEAFSDGVFAIIITIMVLELKVPHDADINALRPLLPIFLTYLLSFIYLGIYWNNHHHLLNVCRQVSGGIMWAIFICFSGCPFFHLSPAGWARTNSNRSRRRFMAAFC